MNRFAHTLPLLAAFLALALPAAAARARPAADAEAAARSYAAKNAASLGLVGGLSLGRERTFEHLSQRIAVFDLQAGGLPVFFRRGAFQVDGAGDVRRSSVDAPIPVGAALPGRDVAREIAAALRRAEADGLVPRHASAGWLVRGGVLRPVVRVEEGGGPAGDPLAVFYDAVTLAPLHEEPLFEAAAAGGLVFRENPATTPEPERVSLFGLDEPGDFLNGAYARVSRCADSAECSSTVQTARPNKEGDFYYLPDLGPDTFDDPFSEVNVYYHLSRMSTWLRGVLGWEGLFGDHEWISASVGMDWYNAAYYGGNEETAPYLIFGQDVVDMAYDADVVCHEFGHGVNRSLRSHPWCLRDAYGVDVAPMGLEEGLADIWAQTFNGDPVMDAYVALSRTADNDFVCPDDLVAEGHYEARIVSGFGWDVRERIGAAAWNHVVYRTLPFLGSEAGFDEFTTALAQSATDLAAEGGAFVEPGDADVILEEGARRGFFEEACSNRLVPLEDGVGAYVYGWGRKRTGKRDRPFGLQWVLTAPEGAEAFHLAVEGLRPEDEELGFRVHLSRGDPVGVTWLDVEAVPEGEPEFATDADLTIEGSPTAVDFPRVGEAPLGPGEKVYVLLSADADTPAMLFRGTAYFLPSQPPPAADAGAPLEAEVTAHASPWGNGCDAAFGAVSETTFLAALLM